MEAGKKRIAQALMVKDRYGHLGEDKPKSKPKPKLKVKPKGTNPLKGEYGFLAEYLF